MNYCKLFRILLRFLSDFLYSYSVYDNQGQLVSYKDDLSLFQLYQELIKDERFKRSDLETIDVLQDLHRFGEFKTKNTHIVAKLSEKGRKAEEKGQPS